MAKDKALATTLAELNADHGKRIDQSNARELRPEESRQLIAGLLAGLAQVGRPQGLANARTAPAKAARLVR